MSPIPTDRSDEAPQLRPIAADPDSIAEARQIIAEYASTLRVDLDFQNFESELATLPGEYAPPRGQLMLATVDGAVVGCGALRELLECDYPNACEMKRLYVRPAFRRCGLGRRLVQALLDEAHRCGYTSVLLDTLDDMEAARSLYLALGFEEIPPYYFNPVPGAHYLKVDLD